jgi:hypothetical protein
MNKKQLIVIWIMATLLCIGLVISTYTVWYNEKPNTLDGLLDGKGQWCIGGVNRIDVVLVNLVRYVSPVLIIGGLLLYNVWSKTKK